ncbi:hypothetical protein D3C73_1327670 [compost metagenome]
MLIGDDLHASAMGQGNLIGYIKAKAKPLSWRRRQRPGEGLEQLVQGLWGDGVPVVVHAKHELLIGNRRPDRHRPVRRTMGQRVGDKVGE